MLYLSAMFSCGNLNAAPVQILAEFISSRFRYLISTLLSGGIPNDGKYNLALGPMTYRLMAPSKALSSNLCNGPFVLPK